MSGGPEVEAFARRVPAWRDARIEIRPLDGGITNRNYVITSEGADYVVRLPRGRTELLGLDRTNELEAATRAADLGLGPRVFGLLPGADTLITALVPGRHLDADGIVGRLGNVVALLQAFHASPELNAAFPVFRVVEWHARDAGARGIMAPPAYERLHQQSRRIERAFAAAPMSTVPCHNDLLPANLVFDDERAWLLDFEFGGMNDRFFDLANLSVNSGLSTAAEEHLLGLYFGGLTPYHWARLQLMKIMSEFRQGMRAVVQQSLVKPEVDFVAQAAERLANCERLAGSAHLETWLHDAARPMTIAGHEIAS